MCCCLLLTTALSQSPLTYLSVPKIKEWICLRIALTTRGFVSSEQIEGCGAPSSTFWKTHVKKNYVMLCYLQQAQKVTVSTSSHAGWPFCHLAFKAKAIRVLPLCTHSSCTVSTLYSLLHQGNNITFCLSSN